MVRKSHQVLPQIVRRLTEMEKAESDFKFKDVSLKIRSCDQFNGRDSWFLTKSKKSCLKFVFCQGIRIRESKPFQSMNLAKYLSQSLTTNKLY